MDHHHHLQHYGAVTTANDNHPITHDDLERTIQHQADTIEALHLAAAKYKSRLDAVEAQLVEREAEIGALSVLSQENSMLRSEVIDLREAIRTLEQSTARIMDKNTLGTETHAQLGVRVQAYQRHNSYLQGELSERERKVKLLQDKVDMLGEENHTKDRRIAVMLEKLRQHNMDPTSTVMSVRVPEETFATMKVKLTSQGTTIELLHERIEGLMDDCERKTALIEAVQKENRALRTSVQKLIAQVTQQAMEVMSEADDGHLAAIAPSSPSAVMLGAGSGVAAGLRGGGGAAAAGAGEGAAAAASLKSANANAEASGYPSLGGSGNGGISAIEQRLAAFRQRNPRLA